LLRIDAARHSNRATRPSVTASLEAAFDVYASGLSRTGWQLTEPVLTELIPEWVFQWALTRGWLEMTRRASRRVLSDADLQRSVRTLLAGRIIYWQAETLAPKGETVQQAVQESVPELMIRLRERYTLDFIADKSGLKRSTFYNWWRDPGSVRDSNARIIVSNLRRFAKTFPSR
jgi:hypothetical protein